MDPKCSTIVWSGVTGKGTTVDERCRNDANVDHDAGGVVVGTSTVPGSDCDTAWNIVGCFGMKRSNCHREAADDDDDSLGGAAGAGGPGGWPRYRVTTWW